MAFSTKHKPADKMTDKPSASDRADAPRHEITPEDRDRHVKTIRELVLMIHNRNDQDTNRVLGNITRHLDALDGNPEAREAERLEAEQNKAAAEKREKVKAEAESGKKAENVQ